MFYGGRGGNCEGDYAEAECAGVYWEENVLRATDLGLGSLWVRDTTRVAGEIMEMFGYLGMELVCGLVLGYASRDGEPRKKRGLEEIVEWK